jgi:Plasmid encoded RepA protein
MMPSDQPKTPTALTPIQRRIITAASEIMTERAKQIDFLHTVQCQCVLPYRNPGEGVRTWDRKQGSATLRIEAGAALDPKTKKFEELGLPYGEKPRLVLIHLASEAIRTGSPVIDVEGSMTAFARALGMETNGQQLKDLKGQLSRLAASSVRMGMVQEGRAYQVNTQIVTAFDLWYPDDPTQKVLWPSTVRLSHEFFESLGRHAVPLDHRAVRAIAHSSFALDLYTWLAQRLHRISVGKPQFITWAALYDQFGQGFTRVRDFRRTFLKKLVQVRTVYPASRMEANEKGLTLYNSPTPVPSKNVLIDVN